MPFASLRPGGVLSSVMAGFLKAVKSSFTKSRSSSRQRNTPSPNPPSTSQNAQIAPEASAVRSSFISRHPDAVHRIDAGLKALSIAADAAGVPGLGTAVTGVQLLFQMVKVE